MLAEIEVCPVRLLGYNEHRTLGCVESRVEGR